MKAKRVFHTVFALAVLSAMLACSFISRMFTEQPNSSSEQPSGGEEENGKPIVGTWKQVVTNGLTSSKNQQLPSGTELDGYYYFATAAGQTDLCGKRHEGDGAEIWRTRDGNTWEAVVKAGFGDPDQDSLQLAVWHDRLYVVAYGGRAFTLWVSEDGKKFRQIKGPWTNNETADLHIINGRLFLFAGTIHSQNGLQAWELSDEEKFSKVFDGGLGDPTSRVTIGRVELPTLDGWTYMGVINSDKGGEIWRTKDGVTWERSLTGGFDNPAVPSVISHLAFQDNMYAAYYPYPKGVNVVRTVNGNQWEKVVEDAFGLGEHHAVAAFLKEFKDVLYLVISNEDPRQCGSGSVNAPQVTVPQAGPAVGPGIATGPAVNQGGQSESNFIEGFPLTGFTLWKAPDGKDWKQIGEPGFGDPNYFWAGPSVVRGIFYLCATNYHDGNKVWRSSDGENWEEFFTAPVNQTTYGCAITEVDDSLLYIEGDINKGVQVWRYGK